MQLLLHELAALYRAHVSGCPPEITPTPVQYQTFAAHEHSEMTDASFERELRYWSHQLKGVAAVALPSDRPRPDVTDPERATYLFQVPKATSTKLFELARRCRVTPFMALLGVHSALLARLAKTTDVVVPTLMAGRDRTEWEHTVGFFLNAVLIRLDFSGNPSFEGVLNMVRESCLEAYEHRNVPIVRVLEEVPDVELFLADEQYALMPFQLLDYPRGLMVRSFGEHCMAAEIPRESDRSVRLGLSLPLDGLVSFRREGEILCCSLIYSPERFDPASIRALAYGYINMALAVTAAPGRPIGAVQSVSEP
jgi:hypothetical protein